MLKKLNNIILIVIISILICSCDDRNPIESKIESTSLQQTTEESINAGNQKSKSSVGEDSDKYESSSTDTTIPDKHSNDNSISDSVEETNLNTTISPTLNPAEEIEPLDTSDFIVSDEKNVITLDSLYTDFKAGEPENKIENNYVGEVYSDDYVYKTYLHEYPDYDLYVSNSSYNLKERDMYDYYITQITLKNSKYTTARGIIIGSSLDDIFKAYGDEEKFIENKDGELIYKFNDMQLSFTLDKNHIVKQISLYIYIK